MKHHSEVQLAQLRKLARYKLVHCNDMGEDYMSRCYVVAEPSDGSEELMAGKHEWIRADQVSALLTDLEAAPPQSIRSCHCPAKHGEDCPLTIDECEARMKETAPTAKEQHLMDLYAALGIRWGDDPFPVVARMRKAVEGEAAASRPAGAVGDLRVYGEEEADGDGDR